MTQNPPFKTTGDGSHTLYSNRFKQHYHNPNGAVAESKHNFFETNGLYDALKNREQINILEVGFGTGLNLLLLMDALHNLETQPKVIFYSIEAYPISGETASALNFGSHLDHPELAEELPPIFEALKSGINSFGIAPYLHAHIFFDQFDEFEAGDLYFDFIFHDAFSPAVNPDLWSGEVFKKLLNCSHKKALLTTYSAASKAKGAMAWAGWNVAQASGALGKREMTVASPSSEALTGFKNVNQAHLARRYEEGDF